MEKYKEIGLDHPIGMTLIIGPNGSHASTLLASLRRTVARVRGFAFLNMDKRLLRQLTTSDKGGKEHGKQSKVEWGGGNPED